MSSVWANTQVIRIEALRCTMKLTPCKSPFLVLTAISLVCVYAPAAHASIVIPNAKPTAAQTAAVERALAPSDRGQHFQVGTADLNNDGRPDLIAQFTSGEYCGSMGCSGFALLATARGYALHAISLPNFQEKITILKHRSHGMHDLRFDDAHYVFRWNGKTYR
jgi:hypothetical protein